MKLEDIVPLTDLERDAASLIERAHEQRSPIVITQNGRATAVLQDVASYEQDQRAFALSQLALQGETDIAAGRSVTRAEHKKRLAARLKAHATKGHGGWCGRKRRRQYPGPPGPRAVVSPKRWPQGGGVPDIDRQDV